MPMFFPVQQQSITIQCPGFFQSHTKALQFIVHVFPVQHKALQFNPMFFPVQHQSITIQCPGFSSPTTKHYNSMPRFFQSNSKVLQLTMPRFFQSNRKPLEFNTQVFPVQQESITTHNARFFKSSSKVLQLTMPRFFQSNKKALQFTMPRFFLSNNNALQLTMPRFFQSNSSLRRSVLFRWMMRCRLDRHVKSNMYWNRKHRNAEKSLTGTWSQTCTETENTEMLTKGLIGISGLDRSLEWLVGHPSLHRDYSRSLKWTLHWSWDTYASSAEGIFIHMP